MIRNELYRAIKSRSFLISAFLGISVAIIAAITNIIRFDSTFSNGIHQIDGLFINQFANSAYTLWIPMGIALALPNLFFFTMPILIGFAHSCSYRKDIESGYCNYIIAISSRKAFYYTKLIVCFIIGGLLITIPMLLNMLLIISFVPFYTPDITDVVYTGIWTDTFLSEVFYKTPAMYMVLRYVINFLLSGLWSVCILSFSLISKNTINIVIVPYLYLFLIKMLGDRIALVCSYRFGAITLLDQLKVRGDNFYYSGAELLMNASIMLLFSITISHIMMKKDIV